MHAFAHVCGWDPISHHNLARPSRLVSFLYDFAQHVQTTGQCRLGSVRSVSFSQK